MREEWQKRINEIDERLDGLEAHSIMWGRAGLVGGNMALKANSEISTLRKEKDRLLKQIELEKEDELNGTNKLKIFLIQNEIDELKEMKKQVNFFKKIKINSQISREENDLKLEQEKGIK